MNHEHSHNPWTKYRGVDSGTPAWVRALVVAALAYLINPIDAIPDALPGIGLSDDLAVLALALERASHHVTPAIRQRAKKLAPKWLGGDDDND